MKKALAILSALALVGSVASAEITFGAWGRGVFVPAQSTNVNESLTSTTNKSVITTENVTSWGGNQRIGYTVKGNSDNIGFQVDVTNDISAVGIGDNAKVWVKLNDMLKLEFGKVQYDALRGKIGDAGGFQRYVGTCTDEDAIFKRMYPGNGAVLELTPVEGFVLAASVSPGSDAKTAIAEDVYKKVQVGAGYTIAGIGMIRAQYIGNTGKIAFSDKTVTTYYWDSTAKAIKSSTATVTNGTVAMNSSIVQAAFNLTAVENLNLDIGATIPLESTYDVVGADTKGADSITVNLGARYTMDKIGIYVKADLGLGRTMTISGTKAQEGLYVDAFIEPTYALDAFTIGLDAAYGMKAKDSSGGTSIDKTDASHWGVAPFIQKGFSNGKIKAGFAFAGTTTGGTSTTTWAIPVLYEYWF